MVRSDMTRAYCIGATNGLFIQRRDLLDVIVTVNEFFLHYLSMTFNYFEILKFEYILFLAV